MHLHPLEIQDVYWQIEAPVMSYSKETYFILFNPVYSSFSSKGCFFGGGEVAENSHQNTLWEMKCCTK